MASVACTLLVVAGCAAPGSPGTEPPQTPVSGTSPSSDAEVSLTADAAPDDLSPSEESAYLRFMDSLVGPDGPASSALSGFWRQDLSNLAAGLLYRDLTAFVPYGTTPVDSPCGALAPSAATYCSDDASIYYDEQWLRGLYRDYGGFGPGLVLAHEFGHHISASRGSLATGVALELEADCLAGRFTGAALDGHVSPMPGLGTFTAASVGVFGLRDLRASAWFDPLTHGTPSARARAFLDGAAGQPWQCQSYGWLTEPGRARGVGDFSWVPSPDLQLIAESPDQFTVSSEGTITLVQALGSQGGASGRQALPGLITSWDDGSLETIGEPAEFTAPGVLPGSVATQRVQGPDLHGLALLYVTPTDQSVLVLTVRQGPTPAADDAAWQTITAQTSVTALGLCPPDHRSPVCPAP